jgi:hypothetical protein
MGRVADALSAGRMPTTADIQSVADIEALYACPPEGREMNGTIAKYARLMGLPEGATEADVLAKAGEQREDARTQTAIEIGRLMGVPRSAVLKERAAQLTEVSGSRASAPSSPPAVSEATITDAMYQAALEGNRRYHASIAGRSTPTGISTGHVYGATGGPK